MSLTLSGLERSYPREFRDRFQALRKVEELRQWRENLDARLTTSSAGGVANSGAGERAASVAGSVAQAGRATKTAAQPAGEMASRKENRRDVDRWGPGRAEIHPNTPSANPKPSQERDGEFHPRFALGP
jgi:hypothetical protein